MFFYDSNATQVYKPVQCT